MRMDVDLTGLEDKWSLTIEEPPVCCVCGLPVGGEEHAEGCPVVDVDLGDHYPHSLGCECGADDVPILLFLEYGGETWSLAFHPDCFGERLKDPPQGELKEGTI